MGPPAIEHRRTHNLLLVSKLFNQRETASPFTLVLDSLEQSARPLLSDCIQRATTESFERSRTRVVFASLESLKAPPGVDVFILLWQHGPSQLREKLDASLNDASQRYLLIIDCLNGLSTDASSAGNLPGLLSSLLRPNISLFAVYHLDVPVTGGSELNPYQASSLDLLRYLATSIITVHCLHHILARKQARDRGHEDPAYGLQQGTEGLLVGEGAQGQDGLVLEMEFRRKSGRGVKEWYCLYTESSGTPIRDAAKAFQGSKRDDGIILLEDHPLWKGRGDYEPELDEDGGHGEVTFSLGLTERQRQDREGVVLPYFDAQKGGGEGGRILYDMGVEDDFDDEEDEI